MARPQKISSEEIEAAARAVFVEHGPSAPVSMIAKRLGVTHAALFQRVGSKAALLRLALGSGKPDGLERLLAEPPTDGVREALITTLGQLMGFLRRLVPNLVVRKAAGMPLSETSPTPLGVPPPLLLRRLLASWLERGVAGGQIPTVDSHAAAEGLLGAMEARCFNAYLGGAEYAPGNDTDFLTTMVDGLIFDRPRPTSQPT